MGVLVRANSAAYVDYSLMKSVIPSVEPISDAIHQTGTGYSSNNAGDGPEKTRDRKSWFPRFKSNWLGTFRSKQMFLCCECAVVDMSNNCSLLSQAGRYKGAEGKHCRCGKDQWYLAKSVEETEYNRRMEISKALGGMRYDDAVLRLRSMGQSELDFKPSEHHVGASHPTNIREFTPSSSSSSSLMPSTFNLPKRTRSISSGPVRARTQVSLPLMKPEQSMLPTMLSHVYGYDISTKQDGGYDPGYSTNGIEYAHAHSAEYEHHAGAAPFGDEESFGELLQGILEDDPRSTTSSTSISLGSSQVNSYAGPRCTYYTSSSVAPLKRTMSMPSYVDTLPVVATQSRHGMEHEYYAETRCRSSLNFGGNQAPSYMNYPHEQPQHQVPQHIFYHQQQEHHQQQHVLSRPISMAPNMSTTTSTSFST
ncbi:hypothetical protein PsorP6_007420 [Peronosclerospora sorghi]|uniref:Uncharacterized protein n=1 Tax=Peronosclerospora sorghi TaxID=230839 RepID=A0ACC0WA58_9STRA|nr:hypothetical protein PsorP6_007420 [Peronosclerospora sorghi]